MARVTLPPQTVQDGSPLLLLVTDGYINDLDLTGLPKAARGQVEKYLAPIVGQHWLTRPKIEHHLILAGETPGVRLRSTLKAGAAHGAATLGLDGTYEPVSLSLSADNGYDSNLGTYNAEVGLHFNNLIGLGEVGYLRFSGLPGFGNDGFFAGDPRNRQVVAGFSVPLGNDGLHVWLEGVDSRTHPGSGGGFTMPDRFQRISTGLGYSWNKSRDKTVATVVSLDVTNETQQFDIAGIRSIAAQDKLRSVRVTLYGNFKTGSGARISATLVATMGFDALGARRATLAVPMTRDGAAPDFRKLELAFNYAQSFSRNRIDLYFKGNLQTSFGAPLASSQQLGLGGMNWLSAFESGAIMADTGAVIGAEIAFPHSMDKALASPGRSLRLVPYLFSGAGNAWLLKPTATERRTTFAWAVGAGLGIALPNQGGAKDSSLTLDYAKGKADGLGHANRFNLRFTTRF